MPAIIKALALFALATLFSGQAMATVWAQFCNDDNCSVSVEQIDLRCMTLGTVLTSTIGGLWYGR